MGHHLTLICLHPTHQNPNISVLNDDKMSRHFLNNCGSQVDPIVLCLHPSIQKKDDKKQMSQQNWAKITKKYCPDFRMIRRKYLNISSKLYFLKNFGSQIDPIIMPTSYTSKNKNLNHQNHPDVWTIRCRCLKIKCLKRSPNRPDFRMIKCKSLNISC